MIHNFFSIFLPLESSSSHVWVFSTDLSLKILGMQPPMRLAIATHVSADTEFTCKGFVLDCSLSLGTAALNTKANRVTPCSLKWKYNCPKHSKHTCPTKDYFKAIWSFPVTCIWTPQTTIQYLFLTWIARWIRTTPPEISRNQKQTWEVPSQKSFSSSESS